MRINDAELDLPLMTLRALLGDARVEELQERAASLRFGEDYSAEELLCFAEFFRLCAETEARAEAMGRMKGGG